MHIQHFKQLKLGIVLSSHHCFSKNKKRIKWWGHTPCDACMAAVEVLTVTLSDPSEFIWLQLLIVTYVKCISVFFYPLDLYCIYMFQFILPSSLKSLHAIFTFCPFLFQEKVCLRLLFLISSAQTAFEEFYCEMRQLKLSGMMAGVKIQFTFECLWSHWLPGDLSLQNCNRKRRGLFNLLLNAMLKVFVPLRDLWNSLLSLVKFSQCFGMLKWGMASRIVH